MVYALGAVKPWVRDAANEIGTAFDVSTIYGVGARANASDHPIGLALDFMVYTDRAKGDRIAAYCKQHWGALSIKYIIWYQRIDNGSGWESMKDRGGTTANHKDHVHVSFNNAASGASYSGNATDDAGAAGDSSGNSGYSGLSQITSSATWIRILEFIAGAVLIIGVFWDVIINA
jgi:hypothetical protein